MAERTASGFGPNPKIGSIEYIDGDGFIVESADPQDPAFIGGKRLFNNFDELLRFMANYMKIYKGEGNTFGIKPSGYPQSEFEEPSKQGGKQQGKHQGGNGVHLAPSLSEVQESM